MTVRSDGLDLSKAEAVLALYIGRNPYEELLNILTDIQHEYGWVPPETVKLITSRFGVPESQIYGVLTFYSDFRLRPSARHNIVLCEGAACYFKGARRIRLLVGRKLGLRSGQVSADGKYSFVRTNFCFGACHLAPVVDIDGVLHPEVDEERMEVLLQTLKEAG
jgi:NADH:ubiquinone oxidoreductase subunit E